MNRSEKFWDRAADTYDREEEKDRRITTTATERARKYLRTSHIVLDYACGTGTVDIEIAGYVKRIRAIDTSPRMIALARRKTADRAITNVDYLQATIYDERIEKESFDAVTAFAIIHLVEDTPTLIGRIAELLRPEGVFVSATPCTGEKPLYGAFLSLAGRIGLVPGITAFKSSELRNTIEERGFRIVETERLHPRLPIYFIAAIKTGKMTLETRMP